MTIETLDVHHSLPPRNSQQLSTQYLFHLEDLEVRYGSIRALQAVNLSVRPGEILFVTGASGAGKTTLLDVLAGHRKPYKGLIKVFQQVSGPPFFCARVFQENRLLSDLSCEENLFMAYDPNVYRRRSEFKRDMLEMAEFLGVKDSLKRNIEDCNGGLKQKISLMRALLTRPDVLLADEPTSSLDRQNAFRVFELLNFINHRKKLTVIWASHNRDLVKQFTGKMVHLEKGKLIYSGHACFI